MPTKEATSKRLRKAMKDVKMSDADLAKMTESEDDEESFVSTQQDLADALGIARETVNRWTRESGCPGRRKGLYNVLAWKAWMDETGKVSSLGGSEPPSPMKSELEIRKLTAVCERLELEQKIRLGQYHTNDDCKLWVSKAMTAVRTIMLSLPSKMAPVVEMRPKEEIELLLREAVDEALIAIHEKEWPTSKV
jgi:hypothetical protein